MGLFENFKSALEKWSGKRKRDERECEDEPSQKTVKKYELTPAEKFKAINIENKRYSKQVSSFEMVILYNLVCSNSSLGH